jgi:hypothetical protein
MPKEDDPGGLSLLRKGYTAHMFACRSPEAPQSMTLSGGMWVWGLASEGARTAESGWVSRSREGESGG